MLVHDIRRNESHLIDFRESAPGALREEALQRSWDTKVGTLARREGPGGGRGRPSFPSANLSIDLQHIYYGMVKCIEQKALRLCEDRQLTLS